jgi:hypothetical protein
MDKKAGIALDLELLADFLTDVAAAGMQQLRLTLEGVSIRSREFPLPPLPGRPASSRATRPPEARSTIASGSSLTARAI